MGTVITAHVVGQSQPGIDRETGSTHALDWFDRVERVCSRFDPESELCRLAAHVGEPMRVSDILFEAVRFAVTVAYESNGAFDPTVGPVLVAAGFDREHRTGRRAPTSLVDDLADYHDIIVNEHEKTLMLAKPMSVDLGAVAKGLAVDLAARSLLDDGFHDFVIDAGGDLYLAGHNANGEPWSIGIRHPRASGEIIETLRLTDVAVCTSGDYERMAPNDGDVAHHIVDPRTDHSVADVASVTVIAPSALAADALSTAAFVLGPVDGIAFLQKQDVRGFMYTTSLERISTDQ
jgi:thiamine biosynthesis lipoprotein